MYNFTIGDRVRCIGQSSGRDGDESYGGGGWSLGFEFTVSSMSLDGGIARDGMGHGVWCHHLELASHVLVKGVKVVKAKTKWFKVSEVRGELREGDFIETDGSGLDVGVFVRGEIGEVTNDRFYVWQDEERGNIGLKNTSEKGYRFSWGVIKSNVSAIVRWLSKSEIREFKKFEVGDRVETMDYKAKIVFIDNIYYHLLRDDTVTGGGILLKDGKRAYVYGRVQKDKLKLISKGKLKDRKIEYGEPVIDIGLFVRSKFSDFSGMVEGFRYESSRLNCCVRLFKGDSKVFPCSELEILKEQEVRKIKFRLRMYNAFREMCRDCLGTKEENDLIRAGCLVEMRNLKENENLVFGRVGGKFVAFSVDGDRCNLDMGVGFDLRGIEKSRVKFAEDLTGGVKLRMADILITSFNQYKGGKSPILLLGLNKKGVIDAIQLATDGGGCSGLGTMSTKSFYLALRNLSLMKRKWVGFGVMFASGYSNYGYRLATASGLLLRCYSPDKVYIGIGTDNRIYPYKLYRDDKIHLVPIEMEVVGKSKGKEVK